MLMGQTFLSWQGTSKRLSKRRVLFINRKLTWHDWVEVCCKLHWLHACKKNEIQSGNIWESRADLGSFYNGGMVRAQGIFEPWSWPVCGEPQHHSAGHNWNGSWTRGTAGSVLMLEQSWVSKLYRVQPTCTMRATLVTVVMRHLWTNLVWDWIGSPFVLFPSLLSHPPFLAPPLPSPSVRYVEHFWVNIAECRS